MASCQVPLTDDQKTADAVYLELVKEYTLNDDGSSDFTHYHKLLIQSPMAFNRQFGESFIVYDTVHQQLIIKKSITTQADGTEIPTPDNAYNLVLPRWAASNVDLNHLREMVVTHTGLETGCIVEFEYTLHTQPGFHPNFSAIEHIVHDAPIKKLEIIVKTPEDVDLNYKLFNDETTPSTINNAGHNYLVWRFADVKEMAYEQHTPVYSPEQAYLAFSNTDWETLLSELDVEHTLTPEITDYVTTKLTTDTLNNMLELHKLVKNELVSHYIPFEQQLIYARDLNRVWKANSATELEKAIMLNTLFNQNGLQSEVFVSIPRNIYESDLAIPELIHGFVLETRTNSGDGFLIEPLASVQNKVNELNAKYELVSMNGRRNEQIKSSAENSFALQGELKLFYSGKASGEVQVNVTGDFNDYIALKSSANHAKSYVNGLVKPDEVWFAQTNELSQESSAHELKFFGELNYTDRENYKILEIPEFNKATNYLHHTNLIANRQHSLELRNAFSEEVELVIELPANWELVNGNVQFKKENRVASLDLEISELEGKVFIKRKLMIRNPLIAPEEYPEFREIMQIWQHPNYKKLILKY